MSIFTHIEASLSGLKDEKYALSQKKIIPEPEASRFLGVRTPDLRKLAKELRGTEDAAAFLTLLPHGFSMERGELTNTLKIKRRVLNENYKREIDLMYEE